ncbi:hypothetical protein BDR22DRAFT_557586 [Usnea florida]
MRLRYPRIDVDANDYRKTPISPQLTPTSAYSACETTPGLFFLDFQHFCSRCHRESLKSLWSDGLNNPDLTGDVDTMFIGQILPLFVLVANEQHPNRTQPDLESYSYMNQINKSTCRSTSELRLPGPTHQRLMREQVEVLHHLRHPSDLLGALYDTLIVLRLDLLAKFPDSKCKSLRG